MLVLNMQIKQVIAKNSPQEYNEAAMFHFAGDIIMQLDPEDYHSFIFEGMKRPKHYLQATATSSAAISKAKGIVFIVIINYYRLP